MLASSCNRGRYVCLPEMDATNVGALVEAKDGAGLVERNVLGQSRDVLVKGTSHVVELGSGSA